jgi:hypothetical protein
VDKTCARGSGFCAQQPDEILLHEMVHALRDMQGLTNPVPTTTRYKNEEEFLAIVIANVYVSVKRNDNEQLRKDYVHFGVLEKPLNTSNGFLADGEHKKILEFYATRWQSVFDPLEKINTTKRIFNPFSLLKKKP